MNQKKKKNYSLELNREFPFEEALSTGDFTYLLDHFKQEAPLSELVK